jgi:5'(3')-deoxyribonucleotidase
MKTNTESYNNQTKLEEFTIDVKNSTDIKLTELYNYYYDILMDDHDINIKFLRVVKKERQLRNENDIETVKEDETPSIEATIHSLTTGRERKIKVLRRLKKCIEIEYVTSTGKHKDKWYSKEERLNRFYNYNSFEFIDFSHNQNDINLKAS